MTWQYYHSVWFVMAFGWISLYLTRMGLAPLLEMIMGEFQISYATAGSLFSAIFYSYGLMQLPSGYVGDRFGRKRILIIGTLLWFILSLGTALVQTFAMLVFVRFLTGMAHGIYFGNERPIIIASTPKEKMGQGQAFSFMGLGFGLFFSVFFAGLIAEQFHSWRAVYAIFSIPSLITSFVIFKIIKEPQRAPPGANGLKAKEAYRRALFNRDLWLMYIFGFMLLFAYWMLVTWMPSIYVELGIKGVTSRSLLSAILGLIGVPGMIIFGMVSDRIVQKGYGRKVFIGCASFVWAMMMLAIGYALGKGASSTLITILFFSSAFVVFGVWPPYFALLSEMTPEEIVGTTFGLANFIGFFGAWIAPPLTGWIKDYTGSFLAGFYLSGILLVLGTVIILMVRPSLKDKA
jgi:MFS family permease